MQRCTVLLIDDDPVLRDALTAALDPQAFVLVTADGPGVAASLCRDHEFAVVVCARLATLASFRAATIDLPEVQTLVMGDGPKSRRWTMTSTVRFSTHASDPEELRSVVLACSGASTRAA